MRNLTAIFLVICCTAAPVLSDEAADEETVWGLQETYWALVKNNDIDGYLQLWDEDFVGWPGFSTSPVYKETIADLSSRTRRKQIRISFLHLERFMRHRFLIVIRW